MDILGRQKTEFVCVCRESPHIWTNLKNSRRVRLSQQKAFNLGWMENLIVADRWEWVTDPQILMGKGGGAQDFQLSLL